LSKEPYASYIL